VRTVRYGASVSRSGAVRPIDGQLQHFSISGSGSTLVVSGIERGGRYQLGVGGSSKFWRRRRHDVGYLATATSAPLLTRRLFPVAVFRRRRDVIDWRRRRLPAVGRLPITHDASPSELQSDFR